MATAVSLMRFEKPHSLSYQDSTRTNLSSMTLVWSRAKVEDAGRGETLQSGLGDAGALGLAASNEAPLILGDLREAVERGVSRHHCTLPH